MNAKDFTFKHPFTCVVSGPTGSGKTILIRNIIKNFKILISNYNNYTINVLWAFGQSQIIHSVPISKEVKLEYNDGLPSETQITEFKPDIIVVDDLMYELQKSGKLEKLFTKQSHHLKISIFFIVQNLFYKSQIMRTISLNAHYFILLKNPRDYTQVMYLARQIFPSSTKYFLESFNDATKSAYGYLKVDLKPDTPENLRLQTRILPEENKMKFEPIYYKIKDDKQPK